MLYVIVGENTVGKTKYLLNVFKSVEGAVVTNLPTKLSEVKTFSSERLDVIGSYLGCEVLVKSGVLFPEDKDCAIEDELLDLVTTMCLDGDVLILDEPDLLVDDDDTVGVLYNYIWMLAPTYNDVYVATHDNALVLADNVKLVTVDIEGRLIDIDRSLICEGVLQI